MKKLRDSWFLTPAAWLLALLLSQVFPAFSEEPNDVGTKQTPTAVNTVKTWGNETQGKTAQEESFSLANVVAELKAHNSPTWSALERQCLKWASELGTVLVITGPIYNDLEHARHIEERTTDEKSRIPFPDALFCVVIGKRAGKTASGAAGLFLMAWSSGPHLTTAATGGFTGPASVQSPSDPAPRNCGPRSALAPLFR